jgi:hypothetical protein
MIHTPNKSNVLKNSFIDYHGSWTKSTWATGSGFTFEAKVVSKRRHTIKTGNDADLPTRLVAIQVEVVGDVMRREWDAKTGEELIPQITQNTKSIKGYLHHFNSSDAHAVNTEKVETLIGYLQKMSSVGLVSNDIVTKLHPKARHNIELWGDQANFLDLEFDEGDIIRVKTIGDSVIIDSMLVVNQGSTKTFSAGGSGLGESWTSKIAKAAPQAEPVAEPSRSAAEDAEWD